MDNYESAAPKGEGKAATGRQPPPLKTLEDISCIIDSPKRKKERHKTTQSIEDTERLWTEIDSGIAMLLPRSLSVRRQFAGRRTDIKLRKENRERLADIHA